MCRLRKLQQSGSMPYKKRCNFETNKPQSCRTYSKVSRQRSQRCIRQLTKTMENSTTSIIGMAISNINQAVIVNCQKLISR